MTDEAAPIPALTYSACQLDGAGLDPDHWPGLQRLLDRLGRHLLLQLSSDPEFLISGHPQRPLIADLGGTGVESALRAVTEQFGEPTEITARRLRALADELDPPQPVPTSSAAPWQLAIGPVDGVPSGPEDCTSGLCAELLRLIATLQDPDALADRLPRTVMNIPVAYLEPGETPPDGAWLIPGLPQNLRDTLHTYTRNNT